MIKICKDCKHYRYIKWYYPRPDPAENYECNHPKYYKRNMVTGEVTYYTCAFMRNTRELCGYPAKLFEAK